MKTKISARRQLLPGNGKRILFLSGIDFKAKSIQVIQKTPEAYRRYGWQVDYIVGRDTQKNGNYSYEKLISPAGIRVERFNWPWPCLRACSRRWIRLLFSKFASWVVIFRLVARGHRRILTKKYQAVYGYEVQGVLAAALLRQLNPSQKFCMITRFQGTFLNEIISQKHFFRLLFYLDHLLALMIKADLLIMTNDGTQGDLVLRKLLSPSRFKKVRFWTNGVDLSAPQRSCRKLRPKTQLVFVSVSRLVGWKRVDRSLMILAELSRSGFENFTFRILGDGEQLPHLKQMAKQLGLESRTKFLGALRHPEAMQELKKAHFFMSMYDSSNVGNPLLEAIRLRKIIVTLDTGDTKKWIRHRFNGLMYCPETRFFRSAARDILMVAHNPSLQRQLKKNLETTDRKMLWTWRKRLTGEVGEVAKLCS